MVCGGNDSDSIYDSKFHRYKDVEVEVVFD
jgi:hypothetical protein